MLLRFFNLFILPKLYFWEHKLIETVFKTQLQYISLEIQVYHNNVAITQLILKRLEHGLPVYSKYEGPKYWGFE